MLINDIDILSVWNEKFNYCTKLFREEDIWNDSYFIIFFEKNIEKCVNNESAWNYLRKKKMRSTKMRTNKNNN